MQHPKWVHHRCPDTTSVNRVKFLSTELISVSVCGLVIGKRGDYPSTLTHVFESVKRVSLTLLFAFTHASYWTGKLIKDTMCIKESLFYLQDKKYFFFLFFPFFFKLCQWWSVENMHQIFKAGMWLDMNINIWREKTYAWTIVHRSSWCITCLYMNVIKIFHTWPGR